MNVVVLVGRLTRKPELRTTQTGKSVCTFSLAVDRRFKTPGQPDADFFDVVAWNRQAEVICQYLDKGRQIAVQGRLQSRSYQAQDGSTRYKTEVVLDNFDFIGSRNDSAGAGGYNQGGAYNQGGYNQPSQYNQPPLYGQGMGGLDQTPLEIDDDFSLLADDDDVPF